MSGIESFEDLPMYTISVIRFDPDGGKECIEFDNYGVLRELLDDIAANPKVRAWLAESDPKEGAP